MAGGRAAAGDTEPSIAVAGLTRARARALGAEFEQDAASSGTLTAWSLVPCDELVAPRDLGWRSSRVAKRLPDPAAATRRAEAAAEAARAVRAEAAAAPEKAARLHEAVAAADPVAGPVIESHEILVADAVRALAAHESETAAIARARELTAATPVADPADGAAPRCGAARPGRRDRDGHRPARPSPPTPGPAHRRQAGRQPAARRRRARPTRRPEAPPPTRTILPAPHGGTGE